MTDEEPEERQEETESSGKFGSKDYIALAIAALETFLLPLVVLIVVIAVLTFIFAVRP